MIRLKIVTFVIASIFLLLILCLFNLEVLRGSKYRKLSNQNCIRLLPQIGARGKILDTGGSLIVGNKLSYDLLILPQELNERDEAFSSISGVLGTSTKNLNDAFRNGYAGPSMPVLIAKNIEKKKAMALEELKIDVPSIIIQPRPVRFYPYGKLASHVMGYINEIDRWRLTKLEDYGYKTKDLVGFGGVEEKYDYYLRQEEGGLSVEVDHRGKFVRVLGFRPPKNGKDLQLTLNLKIQKITEDTLAQRKGAVVIMDPYSGEIIAMASCPDFNPSVFVTQSTTAISGLINNPAAPLINRAISSSYPPGSVFKVVVASAALETKKINSSTTFYCQGSTLIGNRDFKCWSTHNQQNLAAAIAHSCDVFFYRTGLAAGPQVIYEYAVRFGLAKTTGFELPYETSGFVPSPLWRKIYRFKNWFDGDTANLSIGQGDVLTTPLQITRLMAAFANNGYLVTPYIVKSIDGKDISRYQRKAQNIAVKQDTLDQVKVGMKNVVINPTGTANVLADLPVMVAGKTGTAQAPRGASHGWFAGYFPYKNPKYAICVFLERGGSGYASSVLAKQIISSMIQEGLI